MPRMGEGRDVLAGWRQRATQSTSRLRKAGDAASKRVSESIQRGLTATTSVAGDAYTAALNWKDNGEFSRWLTANLSNQRANIATEAMDRATQSTSRLRKAGDAASKRLSESIQRGLTATTSVAGDAYTAALNWKDNGEFSRWLTANLSDQRANIATKAMDAEYIRTHIGGNWHRLYDGSHTLIGSWQAVRDALPDIDAIDRLGEWANAYWKDLITTRGMPIILLDHASHVSQYFKHLDAVNVAQLVGGEVYGVSIYVNWNDPAKLVASATATECAGVVYANVVAPLVSLIGLGRAYFLLRKSEQYDLQQLIAPALKGLSRSGATILLITVIPGGFLIHLSSGIVISVAHGYAWEKANDNKEAIIAMVKASLVDLRNASPRLPLLAQRAPLGSSSA
jgi:hypothetical protein